MPLVQNDNTLTDWQLFTVTVPPTIDKLSTIIPIVQERVDIRKASSDREYTSKFQYLEMLQLPAEQQLIVQKSHLRRQKPVWLRWRRHALAKY